MDIPAENITLGELKKFCQKRKEQNDCGITCPFWNPGKGLACIIMKDSPDTLALESICLVCIEANETKEEIK